MFGVNGRTIYAVLLFTLLMTLLYIMKPSIMYKDNNEIKPFGINKKETILSLGVITVVCAIMSFYLFAIIDMIFS